MSVFATVISLEQKGPELRNWHKKRMERFEQALNLDIVSTYNVDHWVTNQEMPMAGLYNAERLLH